MQLNKPIFAFLALCSAYGQAQAQSNDFFDVSVAAHHDDNISRALLSSDRYSDENLELAISGGRLLQLRTHHDSDTAVRTHDSLELSLAYRKRLSPAWDFSAGAAYEFNEGLEDGAAYASRYSPDNDIYDFEQASVFASLDYTFRNFSSLSASYSFVDGNTVSSALAPNPALLAIADALAPDGAFPAEPWRMIVAYTLATKAHLFALNWSVPVGRDSSLTAGYSRQQIEARRGVDYTNDRVSLTFMHILK